MSEQYQLPKGSPHKGPEQIKVLCLTGGGYRGLFTAQLLARLEAALDPTARPGQVKAIGNRFDLIVGTSIGGILGCALSLGATASELAKQLQRHGPRIFPPMRLRSIRKFMGKPPYSPDNLRTAINACLKGAQSQQRLSAHDKALILTTVDWTSSKLHLLGSGPTNVRDRLGLSLMDAMLATSAAPAHFPSHNIAQYIFVDGGLTANAPDLVALHCVREMWPNADIRMLSVGTANPLAGRDPSNVPKTGMGWAKPVIDICMHSQELYAVDRCASLLGSQHYLRLNAHPSAAQVERVDFDVATDASSKILVSLADDLAEQQMLPQNRSRLMAMV